MISGIPPSTGTTPGSRSTRKESPPVASVSWKAFVGRLNIAAVRALSIATVALPICVLSIFS